MQVLSTKLSIPPLRARLVARQELFQKLDQCLECGFVLVSAPAGYGKTTLLNAWSGRLGYPVAWYALDDGDNDLLRFLVYLLAALRSIDASVGKAFDILLQSSPLPEVEALLTTLVNDLENVRTPFWLVLDDYHVIQNQLVHQAVSFLLEHRPPPLHLAIATRADPPLPLSRLRARAQMIELRLADLRFSAQEISEFLCQGMGLNLSQADLAALETSTEGWAAGLQMAGLSLQGKEDASGFIRSFSGENRYILDYLFDEVFERQSVDAQEFLLQTSILERLCGPLCDRVAMRENSQGLLENLERNNLFLIALDEQRQWYRYHHLFTDLLRNRLKLSAPDQIAMLHQRASAWYAAQLDLENAIAHALAAQDYEQAASLIDQVLQRLDPINQQAMLAAWVDSLPRGVLEKHPWLCAHRAYGYYWTGRRELADEWLLAAEDASQRIYPVESAEMQHIQGFIAATRSHTALIIEDVSYAQAMALKALDLLPEKDAMRCMTAVGLGVVYWAGGDVVQSEQAFGMARSLFLNTRPFSAVAPTCYAGIQQVKQGRLQAALASFRDGLRLAVLPDGSETPIAGFPNIRLGDILCERNQLDLAAQYLARGVKQCIQLQQVDFLTDAYICLGRWQLACGDLEGVSTTLLQADQVAQRSNVDQWVLCWLDDLRLRAWLAAGDLESAILWAQDSGLSPEEPFSYLHDLHHQNLARVLVAQGRLACVRSAHEKASALLAHLQLAAQKAGWVHEELKFLVLQAVNNQAYGKTDLALQALAQALILAKPGGYVRVFLNEGEILRNLLERLAGDLENRETGANGYVASILSAFDHPVKAAGAQSGACPALSQALIEPLSARELEVLKLLAQGCPDKKIAQNLVIASGTVHKHLKNIYGKLGVHSRTEAIVRAGELGLL